VARLNANGSVSPVGGAIEEPLGLAISDGQPVVISHTTSKVLRWDAKGKVWRQFFAASAKGRYGYRCLAAEPGGAMLMTDEKSGQVLVLTPRGRVAMWAKDFASPSGVEIGPDGHAYVADEGDGGLYKITGDGTATQIAGELGRPRGILFLSAKVALVADRDGNVWRVPIQ
jgi:glucose/arabinose dehydrogenase